MHGFRVISAVVLADRVKKLHSDLRFPALVVNRTWRAATAHKSVTVDSQAER